MKEPKTKRRRNVTGQEQETIAISRILRLLLPFGKASKLRVLAFITDAVNREPNGKSAVVEARQIEAPLG